jgi:hypothetical protein
MNKEIWFWVIWMFFTCLFAYYHLHWKITLSLFLAGLLMAVKALIKDYFYHVMKEEQESR